MKKLFLTLILLTVGLIESSAVLKERDLEKTLDSFVAWAEALHAGVRDPERPRLFAF